jgi:hypothetical protein
MPFQTTKATAEGLEWRNILSRKLRWDDIHYVERIGEHKYGIIPLVTVIRVRTHGGRRVDIPGGTKKLVELFRAIERLYPRRMAR